MKHRVALLIITLLALALCLAACGTPAPAPSSSQPTMVQTGGGPPASPNDADLGDSQPTSTGAASGSAAPSGTSAPGGNSSTPSGTGDNDSLQSVTGVINEAGMGKYYVELPDGMVIPFDYTSADLSGMTEFMPGSPITVYFTGSLNGADTAAITVTRMETPEG